MALRTIREMGDPCLRKVCKEVREITDKTRELIRDMHETMDDANGVGLAAPQIGILKRILVLNVYDQRFSMVNPEIVEADGKQCDYEGCLSVPGKSGMVERALHVKVRYLDENGEERELDAQGLLARAVQHEIDHLNGILYVDKLEGKLYDNSELYEEMYEDD